VLRAAHEKLVASEHCTHSLGVTGRTGQDKLHRCLHIQYCFYRASGSLGQGGPNTGTHGCRTRGGVAGSAPRPGTRPPLASPRPSSRPSPPEPGAKIWAPEAQRGEKPGKCSGRAGAGAGAGFGPALWKPCAPGPMWPTSPCCPAEAARGSPLTKASSSGSLPAYRKQGPGMDLGAAGVAAPLGMELPPSSPSPMRLPWQLGKERQRRRKSRGMRLCTTSP